MSSWKQITLLSLLAVLMPILLIAPQSESQSPQKIKTEDEVYREYMVTMSRQLGVTCTACHNLKNFASDEKLEFKTAKQHIKFVQLLIDNGMDGTKGNPKADCYMCHRGKLKPDYKEPFHPIIMQKEQKKKEETSEAPKN